MENLSPKSTTMKNVLAFQDPLGASTKSSTTRSMENLSPQSARMKNDLAFQDPLGASTQYSTTIQRMAYMQRLVVELSDHNLRENALIMLSKSIKSFQELAPLLWNSFGSIVVLLQEIISIYPAIEQTNLTHVQSTRVCNVLTLLQCVASHKDTKMPFLNANLTQYLYPFLQTTNKIRIYEDLRIATLGVIGGLVKDNTREVTCFLLSEIFPLCLRNMEIGNEASKTVATFIIHKMLLCNDGLDYICATTERLFAVTRVLNIVLESVVKKPSPRLLKLTISCYARLSDNHRAGNALTNSLPDIFGDSDFVNSLREDPITWKWAEKLFENVVVNEQHIPSL